MEMDFKQLAQAIKVIAEEKNLPEEQVQDIVQQALAAAWRRDYGYREQELRLPVGVELLACLHHANSAGDMARRLNATLPGVSVPEGLVAELDGAEDRAAKSVEIAGRIIGELRDVCQGVHIMAIGWEARIPAILQAAAIR